MTLILELTPAQEARLREEAARAGMEPAALLLARAGLEDPGVGPDTSERLARFQEWHDLWEQALPPSPALREEEFTRAAFYVREDDGTFRPHESKSH